MEFLAHNGEDFKALALNMANLSEEENMQASGVIHIPTRCIKKNVPRKEQALATSFL